MSRVLQLMTELPFVQRWNLYLFCVLQGVMARPTLCIGDAHSCEESAITLWLQTHSTSPVTGQPLATTDLLPNHALRQMIQAAARH